ncbi:MAG: Xaa-Pro peptidase family protein [Candidatus Woesearchaeota archaeon]|jgi:Xaa-Pro aminopeptidase
MRLKEFQQYLQKEKIDLVLLIHPDVNITYFTQIKPSFAMLSITSHNANLYLTSLDDKPTIKGIEVFTFKKDWDKKMAQPKIKKVGINKEVVTLAFWEKIHNIFPKAKLVDVASELKQLRSKKTEEEVARIAHACKITDSAFEAMLNRLSKGKLNTELQASNFLTEFMSIYHTSPGFPSIIANDVHASIPHYQTGESKLKRGFLLCDFGACYKNYNADMSRTIFLGKPNKEERDLYLLLQTTQQNLLSQVKLGKSFAELQQQTKRELGKYSSHFIHLLGHGIGIDVHESPSFSLEAKDKVEKGHIFTIEPGIYFHKKFGLRIEDTVLFDKKLKVLTKSSKELINLKM